MIRLNSSFPARAWGGLSAADRGYYALALGCGLAGALALTLINMSWFARVPEGWVHSGFLQSDQNFYTAAARAVVERGNGLAYVMPHSLDPAARAVHFQWPLTALGWAWRVTGLPFWVVWEVWRGAWGALFFLAVALTLHRLAPGLPGRRAHAIFVLFGGGAAAALAMLRTAAGGADFFEAFDAIEGAAQWWFLNLARNLIYPLEACYHACFFFAVAAMLAGRWLAFLALYAITLSSGTFVGIELSAIVLLFLAVEWGRARWIAKSGGDGEAFISEPMLPRLLLACLAMTGVFLLYYRVFVLVAGGPECQSLIKQHASFAHAPIPLRAYFISYAIALIGAALGLARGDLRRWLMATQRGRLLLCWIAAVALLINNHLLLPPHGIQPPHFTRGYLFFPLAVIAGLAARFWWRERLARGGRPMPRAAGLALLGVFLLAACADTLAFAARAATHQPHPGKLTFEQPVRETLDALAGIGAPGQSLRVLNPDDGAMGVLIPAWTSHATYLSDAMVTPDFERRIADRAEWARRGGATPFLAQYGIDLVVMRADNWRHSTLRALLPAGAAVVWSNSQWVIVKVN